MIKGFEPQELMRFEFFEYLLPFLVHTGTEEERQDTYTALKEDGCRFLYEMFEVMCNQDQVENPFRETDFKVTVFVRGGFELLKIDLPPYNPAHNDVLRAYLVSVREKDGTHRKKCFTIRYFVEGKTCVMYIDEELETWLAEELDRERLDDPEYEYRRVVNCFVVSYLKDMKEEENREKKSKAKQRKKPDKP